MSSILIGNPYIRYVSCLKRLIPVEVDRFLCCGEQYRTVRNGVGQVLLESNRDALKAALQVTTQECCIITSSVVQEHCAFYSLSQIKKRSFSLYPYVHAVCCGMRCGTS